MARSPAPETLSADAVRPGVISRLGRWAVGVSRGEDFAVDRVCRHQLADLSKGAVGSDGCLVCPWHGARYDVRSGQMVRGPRGFLGWHGPTPGYTQLVRAYARVLKLQVGVVRRADGRVTVSRRSKS